MSWETNLTVVRGTAAWPLRVQPVQRADADAFDSFTLDDNVRLSVLADGLRVLDRAPLGDFKRLEPRGIEAIFCKGGACGPRDVPINVAYTTSNGTAQAGVDYQATAGGLIFSAGETTFTLSVPIIGDVTVEPDEQFKLALSNPTNGVIGRGVAVGRINDDDSPPTISIQDAAATIADGAAQPRGEGET